MSNKSRFIFLMMFSMMGLQISYAEQQQHEMTHHQHQQMSATVDERISLGLPPLMKQHQLANMRSHLEAIQRIVGLIAEGQFETASNIAHTKLGLTEEMQNMCNMMKNEDFKKLGLSFHQSADDLAEVLLTKDTNQSLKALHKTMNYCVQCHATYRQ